MGQQILDKMAEWKEKILFGIVVLATLAIVMKARPIGGGVPDIDANQRQAAIQAAHIDQARAQKVLKKLENPGDWTPVQLDTLRVDRPYYDDGEVFKPTKASAWTLSQETYERLPPLQLSAPGFGSLPDYDLPAGTHPGLAKADAYIPRDTRKVSLTTEGKSEFD